MINAALISRRRRRASSGSVDALIQALINGSADDGYFDAFESVSGFPDPTTDTLLATTRLASPAAPIGNLVNASDIVLNFTDDTPTILADSDFTNPKYFRITESDHTTVVAWGSIGLSSDDFDPDLIVSSMDWTGGGTLNLGGVVHARSVDETLTGYDVPVSNATPIEGFSYTATAQAKAGASALHRIVQLATTYVSTSGVGDGSITESSVITNRYGLTDTLHLVAGTFPTTEHVHVSDGTHTGNSTNVVVAEAAPFALIDSASAGSTGADTGATTAAIDTTGANLITLIVSNFTGTPTVSDSKGNTWALRVQTPATDWAFLFDCANPTVGTGHTFTVTDTGGFSAIAVAAFSGANASPVDQTNSADGGTGPFQPGSVTPSQDNELIVTGVRFGASESAALSIDEGFTIAEDLNFSSGNAMGVGLAYLVQTTAAAVNPTWTNQGNPVGAVIATYKGQL